MKKKMPDHLYRLLSFILTLFCITSAYADYTDEFWTTSVAIDRKSMPLKVNKYITVKEASYNPQLKQVEYKGSISNPGFTWTSLNKSSVADAVCRNNWSFFFVELKGVTFHFVYYRDKTDEVIADFIIGKDDC